MRFAVLLLVSGLTAIISSSSVSASPIFARQTGMACSSCHFQHFPLLNGFGRAFKAAGYTLMGGQTRIEADGLSIPSTLNMAVVTTMGYEKSNMAQAGATAGGIAPPLKTTGDGVIYLPGSGGELSLFFGGRISENAGFLGELAVGDVAGGKHSSAKMPIDMTGIFSFMPTGGRVSIVPFATDGLGASYGFELLNTGANIVQQMIGTPGFNGAHSGAFSAQQYIGTNGPAKGLSLVVSHPTGYVNLTRYDRTGITGGGQASLGSTYLRVAGIFSLGSWDAAAGAQMWSGKSAVANPGTLPIVYTGPMVTADTKATGADAQMQGMFGQIPVGFYVSYVSAPVVAANNLTSLTAAPHLGNAYNTYYLNGILTNGTSAKSSLNVSAEVGVIPDQTTLGASMRFGKSGDGNTDNAIMLTGTYKIARNMLASLAFTSASGSYWSSNPANTGTTDTIGNTTYTFNLFTAF